jgi:hypothetical protein
MERTAYLLSRALGQFNRSRVDNTEILISKFVYDASNNPIYCGFAPQGSLTSEAKWRVEKLSYDASGNFTGSTYSSPDQIFDNYASLTYS